MVLDKEERAEIDKLLKDVKALENPPLVNKVKGEPYLFWCTPIQHEPAELSKSVYFMSLMRVVSLLTKRTPMVTVTSKDPEENKLNPAGNPGPDPITRSALAAASGWSILIVFTMLCQIFLMVLILETSTSSTCNYELQTGCRAGEYCSFSIARGQCNDCSVILPETTDCCPTMNTTCPLVNTSLVKLYDFTYFYPGTSPPPPSAPSSTLMEVGVTKGNGICAPPKGCPGACVMYEHCLKQESSMEQHAKRCDFLVNGRDGVKPTHIFLLIFGAVLWASKLIRVLDETDVWIATVPVLKAPKDIEEKTVKECCQESTAHYAIMIVYKCIFLFRGSALPALTAAGAVVAILTDNGGASLTGGVSVLFSFIVLSFVAELDDAFGKIFVRPDIVSQCETDLGECFNKDAPDNKAKIYWLWNRFTATSLALAVILEALFAEQLMVSDLVRGLRKTFFRFPWNAEIETRGSPSVYDDGELAGACNQLNQTLLVMALFCAWILVLFAKAKIILLPLMAQETIQGNRKIVHIDSCSDDWCIKQFTNLIRVFIDLSTAFCTILGVWWVFGVWISGELMLADRVDNPNDPNSS